VLESILTAVNVLKNDMADLRRDVNSGMDALRAELREPLTSACPALKLLKAETPDALVTFDFALANDAEAKSALVSTYHYNISPFLVSLRVN